MNKYYSFVFSSIALIVAITTIGYYYTYVKCMDKLDYYISENKVIQSKLEENQDKVTELAEKSIQEIEPEHEEETVKPSNEVAQGDEQVLGEEDYLSQMISGVGDATTVDAANIKVTEDTKCVTITYDVASKDKNSVVSLVPEEYVGFDRQALIEYFDEYIQKMPIDEKNKGLLSMELISFSKDNIGVLKRYDSSKLSETYFVIAENDIIMVYMNDQETLYENTEINISKLPEEEKEKLVKGIVIEGKDELISVLESYSS